MSRGARRWSFETRIAAAAFLAGLPGSVFALGVLWTADYPAKVRWTMSAAILVAWVGVAVALRERAARPLQTLANLLLSLREGDFTVRARAKDEAGALGEAFVETNALADALRERRLADAEAQALLGKVMAEVDVAILAFDLGGNLRLANRAAERLMRIGPQDVGRSAQELGLAELLEGAPVRRLSRMFPGGGARWELRRGEFRQGGVPHALVVLTDVERALREEERAAWLRLIRVLGHEINNSLGPIQSVARNLQELATREPRPGDWDDDVVQGLGIIERRAEALGRFMNAYARLARLPPPTRAPVDVEALVSRVAKLETRRRVQVVGGPPVQVRADGDQLEQALINLVRNAVDAALETGGGVAVRWRAGPELEIQVEDDGPGVADGGNLFVPFFTTKPNGSGIGLALSRQIAEAHGGRLTLANRTDGRGAIARLALPLG